MTETNPAIYDLTPADLAALVRHHGANAVLDAVLGVAENLYGDAEVAVVKCHGLFLRRAAAYGASRPADTEATA